MMTTDFECDFVEQEIVICLGVISQIKFDSSLIITPHQMLIDQVRVAYLPHFYLFVKLLLQKNGLQLLHFISHAHISYATNKP